MKMTMHDNNVGFSVAIVFLQEEEKEEVGR